MSKRDAEREFQRMAQAAAECGLDVAGWRLMPGSATNGISYSLLTGQGGADSIIGLPSFGHIGRTSTEAARFLSGMAAAFESITYNARKGK